MATDNPTDRPIAAKERLEELGMAVASYGSCSEPDQRKIQNRGRVWFNRGCKFFHECEWRNNTEHMQARDEGDIKPRPRHVSTKHIKPGIGGVGDTIINSYCPCFRYHKSLKKRDGQNNEIVEVVGGEGDRIKIKSHKKHVNPDNSIYLSPEVKDLVIPRYPDPTEVPELFEHVFAASERRDHKARTVDAARERRLKGALRKEDATFEGVEKLEVGKDGIAAGTE